LPVGASPPLRHARCPEQIGRILTIKSWPNLQAKLGHGSTGQSSSQFAEHLGPVIHPLALMFSPMNRSFLSRSFLIAGFFVAASALTTPHPAHAARIKHPVAVFVGLDKITGRTIAFEAAAGETVQFGTLQITERACYTHPATEAPQTTTFVEVDEVVAGNQYKRIFSGWMFAASPGLHGIEHPIYDIWLTNCEGQGALEAGSEIPAEIAPAEPAAAPLQGAPASGQKQSARPRHDQASENPIPASEGQAGGALREQSGAKAPSLGQPIEVGPPPGFIPVPREGRRVPVQRYYPADSGTVPDPFSGDVN
jgi:hypothetical protein